MIKNNNNPSNCCKFCGWEFDQKIIQRIIDNNQTVVCEFCGIDLDIFNVNIPEGFKKEKNGEIIQSDCDSETKKKSIGKKIKKWIQPEKYSKNVIFGEDDFPKIFKQNLIIVISRLIYFAIRTWEQENNVSVRRVCLEKSIKIYIIKKIRGIIDMKAPSNFLNNLFKINKEDFEGWLRLFQKKMNSNQEYQTHFKFYLNWLIRVIFKLVSDMWEMTNLPRFHSTILKDLKKHDFNSNQFIIHIKNENSSVPPKSNKSIKNPSITKGLKEQIIDHILNKLDNILVSELTKSERLKNKELISNYILEQIEHQISNKNSNFKVFLKRYIDNIVWFLIKVKKLNETRQKITVSKIARKTHDKILMSQSQWYKTTKQIVRYLKDTFKKSIRTTHNDPLELSESQRNQIRSFKNFYKIIRGYDNNGITITYLDANCKDKIEIHYNGKCQGINGYCDFHIDYKFLPSLGYHHVIENYKKNIKERHYEYILPKNLSFYTYKKSIKLMQTQIGGLKLICANCHNIKHSIRYVFPPIFNFLKMRSLEEIDKDSSKIINETKRLTNKYFACNKERYKITRNNTPARIKIDIKRSILGFVKKKYVIEYLFGSNYHCPICQKANINEHLTCFDTHHTNLDLLQKIKKIEFGREYERKSIQWLIKNIISQECIFICSNCHLMINAINYRDHTLNILKNQKEAMFLEAYYQHLDKQIEINREIILQWKVQLRNNNLNIKNLFQIIFKKGEALDQKLVCIYYICKVFSQDLKEKFFNASILNFVLNKLHTHFNNYKTQLLKKGFIQKLPGKKQFNQKFFIITQKGKQRAENVIKNKTKEFPNRFNDIIHIWKERFIKYKDYESVT